MSRDWQKDMDLHKEATEGPDMCIGDTEVFSEYVGIGGEEILIGRFNKTEDALFFCEAHEALPYWLQQYAAEKERADKAERRERKLREAIEETINEALTLDDATNFLRSVISSLYPLPEREGEAK